MPTKSKGRSREQEMRDPENIKGKAPPTEYFPKVNSDFQGDCCVIGPAEVVPGSHKIVKMSGPLVHAAWVHGVGLILEDKSWSADNAGWGNVIYPSNTSRSGWVHFAIPTPVIVEDRRLTPTQVGLRVATGSKATITQIVAHDGEKQIAAFTGLKLTGSLNTYYYQIPSPPQVLWGTEISVLVTFSDRSSDAWAEFVSAGIDFH